jgi:DNA-binding transcriptional LysR family regulator
MDTDRLRYFCAVVEFGSLSKASELLGISHSGLSKSLSLLQKELNLELLRPLGRGLEVTEEGKVIYSKALEIIKQVENLSNLDKNINAVTRIATSEQLSISCAGLFANALSTSILINQLDVGKIEQAILNNEVDFAIATFLNPDSQLEYLSIGHIRFNSYAREDLYKTSKVDVPYAVPLDDLPKNLMGYKIRDAWPSNITRTPRFYVKTCSIAMDLLRTGQAAAFVPDFYIKKENAQLQKDAPKLIKVKEHKNAQVDQEYFLIKLKSTQETSDMKKIAREIRRLCIRS